MSRGSEYAQQVGNLYQLQAQNVAQANQARAQTGLQKAAIWGGTLSNLGQMVAGLPQAMRDRKIAGLKEQDALQTMQDRNLNRQKLGQIQTLMQQSNGEITPALVAEIRRIDYEAGAVLEQTYRAAQKDARDAAAAVQAGVLKQDDIRNRTLAKIDPKNPQSIFQASQTFKALDPEGKDPRFDSRFMFTEPIEPYVMDARRALMTPQELNKQDNPDLTPIKTVGPNGEEVTLYDTPTKGSSYPSYQAPKSIGPLSPIPNPNGQGSVYGTAEQAVGQPIPVPPSTPPAPRQPQLVEKYDPVTKTTKKVWAVPGGDEEFLQAPPQQSARATTGAERQALAFYHRAKEASDNISTPDASGKTLEDRLAAQNLLQQGRLQYLPDAALSPEQQQYRQAQRAFTEARLRKESGAAIPPQEYENDARTYFKQPNDSPAVLAQKKAAREAVLQGVAFSAGKAYEEFYGEPFRTPAMMTAPPLVTPAPVTVGPWTARPGP